MATKKRAKAARPHKRAAVASAASAEVVTLVNGQVTGRITPGTGTIYQAVEQLARDNGLKSYNVRVNNVPCTPEQAAGPLKGVKQLEVFAKDTRG